MNLLHPNIKISNDIYTQFHDCLKFAKGERDVTNFLKRHLYLLRGVDRMWNAKFAAHEVKLGNDYIIDFLTLSADSGKWCVSLFEAQSSNDSIYTKKGSHTKELREAYKQLQEWKIWINHNKQLFREILAKIVDDDYPACCSNASIHTYARSELRDMKTVLYERYVALIGRRSDRTCEKNLRASEEFFEIITYDRLLDEAQKLQLWLSSPPNTILYKANELSGYQK